MTFGRVLGLFAVAAAIAYPALVYVGLTRWSSRWVALIVVAMALVSALAKLADGRRRAELRGVVVVPAIVISLALMTAVSNSHLFLLLTPVFVSAALLLTFGATLRPGATTMIERFARLQDSNLDEQKVAWCRTTTIVWCAFFIGNGATAAILAAWAPLSWWTLYTGLLAYVLMGALFVGELTLRKLRFDFGTASQ